MNKQLLKQYVENGGNCVNLGRFLNATDNATYQWVLDQTPWLNDVKFNERVYCILNDITSQKLNVFGEPATFENIFRGYITKEYTLNRQLKKQQRLAAQQAKPKYVKPTKLELAARRSQRRNPELYLPTAVKNIDYVECPISGIRMHMITSKHIINNLNMTVEQFDQQFPDIVKTSQAHVNAISQGVRAVDPITGLPKCKIAQIKAQETLTQVDENGINGYQKKGQKTRATHMSKIDEFGRNGYSRLATKAIIKGNRTKAKKGIITSEYERTEFKWYKLIVTYLTEKQRNEITSGFITGLAGTDDAYHIDHMYSIFNGFKNKISPLIIGHRENLQMIPWKNNVLKHTTCSISIETLLEKTGYDFETSLEEFNEILNIIKKDIEDDLLPTGAYVLERYNESKICK